MRRTPRIVSGLLSILITAAMTGAAPKPGESLNDWLNEQLKAKIDQNSAVRQTESPSGLPSSTSLIDQSSAADLLGVAFNMAGLVNSSTSGADAESGTGTATLFSVVALLSHQDALDPAFYNANTDLRRLSIVLGYEKSNTVGLPNSTVVGAKFLLVNERDASRNIQRIQRIGAQQADAARVFGGLTGSVKFVVLSDPDLRKRAAASIDRSKYADCASDSDATLDSAFAKRQIDRTDTGTKCEGQLYAEAENTVFGAAGFSQWFGLLTPGERANLEAVIDKHLDTFLTLDEAGHKLFVDIQRRPLLAVEGLSKNSGSNQQDYSGRLVFEYGLDTRLQLTVNGSFDYKASTPKTSISRGGSGVVELKYQVTSLRIGGRSPGYLSVAADGTWLTEQTPRYHAQAKLNFPISAGIDVPLSVTYANRTDLIKESQVSGKFGFTIDTAKLMAAQKQ